MPICFDVFGLGFAVFRYCVLLFGCCVWLCTYYGSASGFWCLLYSALGLVVIALMMGWFIACRCLVVCIVDSFGGACELVCRFSCVLWLAMGLLLCRFV